MKRFFSLFTLLFVSFCLMAGERETIWPKGKMPHRQDHQIAAMTDAHYLIEKTNDGQRTSTIIRKIEGEDSVSELARILGGAEITDSVINSAKEMKKLADDLKKA